MDEIHAKGNSIHIIIRHFFVKDIVYKEKVEVQFWSTHLIISDCFTNPFQGTLFKLFLDLIMRYKHIGDIWKILNPLPRSVLEIKINWKKSNMKELR